MREANPYQLDGNWWNDRLGKLTASRMAAAMNFLKSGKESTERENLRYEIVAERITNTFADKYTTSDMQWGVEQEAAAKERFESVCGLIVTDTRFIDHPRRKPRPQPVAKPPQARLRVLEPRGPLRLQIENIEMIFGNVHAKGMVRHLRPAFACHACPQHAYPFRPSGEDGGWSYSSTVHDDPGTINPTAATARQPQTRGPWLLIYLRTARTP